MADPYISEVKYLGNKNQDFIEIAVTTGTDVSNFQVVVYNAGGTVRTTNALGPVVNTVAGKDVYVIDTATSATFNGLHKFGGVSLSDSSTNTVFQFVSFNDNAAAITATEGPANGLTSTEIGQAGSGKSLESTDHGGTYHVLNPPTKGTVPCLVSGTRVLTNAGERRVETLSVGDMIVTLDHGLQALRWIGRKQVHLAPDTPRGYAPVCIKAHSFGPNQPQSDLWVSANHRILLDHYSCHLHFSQGQVLSAAKFLCDGKNITRCDARKSFCYFHLLFDNHEIILSNNLPSESFHPAQAGLSAFEAESRQEVFALFPELRTSPFPHQIKARRDLRRYEAEILLESLNL